MTPRPRIAAPFLHYLRLYYGLVGKHLFLLGFVTLLTTWAESLGIALLLPLLGGAKVGGDTLSRIVVRVLDTLHLQQDTRSILIALVAVAFLKAFLTFASISYQYFLSERITLDLRRALISAANRVDYRFMLSTNSGNLTSVIYGHSSSVAQSFINFSKLFPRALTVAVFFVILSVVDWRLTIIIGVAGVAMASLMRFPARLSKRYSTAAAIEAGTFAALLYQTIHWFKYLSATNSVEPLHERIFTSIRKITVQGYRTGALAAITYALPQPITAVFLAGLMLYQTSHSANGVATAVVLLIYLYRMMNEIFGLQVDWNTFIGQTGAVDTLVTTLEGLESNREQVGGLPYDGFRDAIEFRDVSFAYLERPVLDHVNMRIPKSTTVAFVGESGSGKTTTVDLVCGLVKPNSGKVAVDGRDLRELDLAAWRTRIGYVPQDGAAFEDTVANNISLWSCDPADPASMERVYAAAKAANCDEFIRQMPQAYLSQIGERGVKLSGGQRQRLAIARELYKQPDVLILDEATSALDSESERYIQQSIESLKGKLTILVIAHRFSTIKGCDYLYVLHDGRIAEEGQFAELMDREGSRFREMARLQNLAGR